MTGVQTCALPICMVVSNIKNLILKNVHVTGCDGEEIIADNVDAIVKE